MGEVDVVKSVSVTTTGFQWMVTFLNNAGNLPLLEVDHSTLWGGATILIDEERLGTSVPVSGSFELFMQERDEVSITLPYDASGEEVGRLEVRRIEIKELRHWDANSVISCAPN